MTQAASASAAKRASFNFSLSDLTAGAVNGFIEVIFAISLASLIFSGALEGDLSRGIAIALTTSTVHILISSLTAPPGILSTGQENAAVIMSVLVASVVGRLGTGADLLPTVIALVFVTALISGVFLLLLGYFKLGGLARYVPYPVIGGFVAGTGWLLVQGSIGTMADFPLVLAALPNLFQPDQLLLWLPGLIFALVLFFGLRRIDHFLVMPGIMVGGLVLFLVALLLTGTSLDAAMERGLLLGQLGGSGSSLHPLPLPEIAQARWLAVFGETGGIATLLLLSATTLLLNISGLELVLRQDVDLNRELRRAGMMNLLSGLLGGSVGFQDLSLSTINYRIGGRGRIAGLVTGGICALVLVLGASTLAYAPKFMFGGLLLFLGLELLYEWVIEGYKQLGGVDYGVVLLILVMVAAFGFLVGVSVGLVLMVLIFVWNYSRINIFHHTLSGGEVASNFVRNAYHARRLAEYGTSIYILELQGFIFFGTANTLLEQIHTRLKDPNERRLQFLILDFRRVTGLDSSAVYSFTKVKYLAEMHNFKVLYTHISSSIQRDLERANLLADDAAVFPDVDRGLEWCEDQLLDVHQVTAKHLAMTLPLQLADLGFKKQHVALLQLYIEKIIFEPGAYLIQQGMESTDLFFIEIGQVSIYLELETGKKVRLQTYNMGTVIGELGFYLHSQRSASVIAELKTIAYRLSDEKLQEMKVYNPELAIALNELMVRVISERLVITNRALAALNR